MHNYAKTKIHLKHPKQYLPRFTPRKTAAMAPLPIERALQTDTLSIMVAYQQQYSNTNSQSKERHQLFLYFFAELKFVVVYLIEWPIMHDEITQNSASAA